MTEEVKRVYAFGKDAQGNNVTEGNTSMKAILGGKGANQIGRASCREGV